MSILTFFRSFSLCNKNNKNFFEKLLISFIHLLRLDLSLPITYSTFYVTLSLNSFSTKITNG